MLNHVAFLLAIACLPALADEPMSDEQFITKISVSIDAAHNLNHDVKLLGSGTVDLLDSGRQSKVGCGKSNPNPKPGECSGAYPIYPAAMPLADATAKEKATLAEAKRIPTAWVAWIDSDGTINIAFNARAGDYEVTTPHEVECNGVWSGIRTYYVSVKSADKTWQRAVDSDDTRFTWLKLGKGNEQDFSARLQALKDLRIIANAQIKTDPTKVALEK